VARVWLIACLLATGLAVPDVGRADHTETVAAWSVDATPANLRATAKLYADAANRIDSECSDAQGISQALSHVRIRGRVAGPAFTVFKLWFNYGHYALGIDSTCAAAQELSTAAGDAYDLSDHVPPACTPSGYIDLNCPSGLAVAQRIEKRVRSFAPDYCVWTLFRYPKPLSGLGLPDGKIHYSPDHGRC
jgi:hypothetical protein